MDWSAARKAAADLRKDQDDSRRVRCSPTSGPSSGSGIRLCEGKRRRRSSSPSQGISLPPVKLTRSKKTLKPSVIVKEKDPDAPRSHALEISGGEDIIEAVATSARRHQRRVCVLSGSGVVTNPTLRQSGQPRSIVALNGRFEILSLSGEFVPASRRMDTTGLTIFLAGGQGQVVGGGVVGALRAAGPVLVFAAMLSTATGVHIALADDEPGEASAAEATSADAVQLPSPQEVRPDLVTGDDEEDQIAHVVKPPVGITESHMEPSCTTQEVKSRTYTVQHEQEPQRDGSSELSAGQHSDGTKTNIHSDKQQQFIVNESISSEDNLFREEQMIFGRQKELSELIELLVFKRTVQLTSRSLRWL